ncbi:sigma-54-dependent Fis family transcriptional regulator [Burkholderia pseudomallei]|uniref:sigma-54-dependent Fis family transcriptional regulator n=1 Tax=Burkholderia pseudomallei TaxID=28450 RepID=UPI001246AB76|nr:sigma-54-dependent Fis family transcriptional regulator [Burkholderia pseudomallei]MPT63856.1 sigma-54-dependent Fis family transcriptional regulator [Burkholderia pseudomallei]MPT67474.1 sigma-54-dependent Fis family transcriptional regulator [Burkholderia pseudomallei]MPT74364.1 sigma-54-dependent Fis family transcriptional regulator [Burkholderia pseudomallei]MPT85620.1 sigma-54-dependent Fis family transcriptional regulator [Burkholderia pseudomallei]MPT91578.1 sigma-54-dependent Fis fa
MPQSSVLPAAAGRVDLLAQAHARSLSVGLRASELPDFSPLSRAALRELIDGSQSLYTHARPVMDTLHTQIADTQSLVLLTDRDGVILHSIGDADFVEKANRVALCPGVSWAEDARGTNAIGTALIAGQALAVHGAEHFLRANHVLTCSCAPIVDPFGRLLGALDVSGDPRGFSPHTLALVKMSAQLIENHLFANQCADALRVRFHAHDEFVDSLFAGLVAFSPSGALIAANRSAQFQLGANLDALQQRGCDELFGLSFAKLAQHAAREPLACFTLTLGTGVRVRARCEFAHAQRTAVAVSARAAPSRATDAARDEEPDAITFATLDTGDARMTAVLQRVGKVRGRDLPVLVLGETGTGKEWLARALHHASPRRDGPFVAVNCAALPDSLIEAELFGYEDGAFTGARKRGSPGKIAQADGGTLFLDEIGDMPLAQQVRLMRVLQERAVMPLGGARAVPVDVRIICATHRDLRAMIAAGTFREDLFYRINGLAVTLPPLAERSDLETLVARVLARLARSEPMPATVSAAVLAAFARCRWPGNLRQMTNVLRTAGMLAEGEARIDVEHLPDDFWLDCDAHARDAAPPRTCADAAAGAAAVGASTLQDHQVALIDGALDRHRGNVSAAARELGLARNTVYRHLRRRRSGE